MAKTKSPTNKQRNGATVAPPPSLPQIHDVLTMPEAAAYLRVSEADMLRLAQMQDVPARLIGKEWRFLKSALDDWLRTPAKPGSREAILSVAGLWKDDPYLEEELKEIYKRRGRPMTEDGE